MLNNLKSIEQTETKETEVNNFAAKKLIKESQMNQILKCDSFDEKKIDYFSEKNSHTSKNIILAQLK